MTWTEIQLDIASCSECISRWPKDVCRPLAVGEIPEPPERVKVLFVGVAPTPHEGQTTGGHFYASATDNLRIGLFKLLAGPPFNLPLLGLSLADGNRRFFEAGLFFIHAAKVRPITKLSPPRACIRHCADRHLRAEIEHIAPRAVCFVGKINAAPAAEELFGEKVVLGSHKARLGSWSGLVAVAPQPPFAPTRTGPGRSESWSNYWRCSVPWNDSFRRFSPHRRTSSTDGLVTMARPVLYRVGMFNDDGFELWTLRPPGPDGLVRVLRRRSWLEREKLLMPATIAEEAIRSLWRREYPLMAITPRAAS